MARLFFHLSIVLDRSNNANCYIFCGFFSLKKLTRMLLLAVIFFLWPIKYATPIMSIWGSLPGQYPMFMKRCKKGQIDYFGFFVTLTRSTHIWRYLSRKCLLKVSNSHYRTFWWLCCMTIWLKFLNAWDSFTLKSKTYNSKVAFFHNRIIKPFSSLVQRQKNY